MDLEKSLIKIIEDAHDDIDGVMEVRQFSLYVCYHLALLFPDLSPELVRHANTSIPKVRKILDDISESSRFKQDEDTNKLIMKSVMEIFDISGGLHRFTAEQLMQVMNNIHSQAVEASRDRIDDISDEFLVRMKTRFAV